MPLLIVVKILNLGNIFPFFLDDIGVSIRCRQIMTTTLFLPPTTPKTSLMLLVFFVSLTLMERRLWVLATRYVNRKSISRFSFLKSFSSFFVDLYSCKYFELISRVPKGDCSNVFTSTSMVFSTTSF